MKNRFRRSKMPSILVALLFLSFFSLLLFTYFQKRDEKNFTSITEQLFKEEMLADTLNMHYTIAHPQNYGLENYQPTLSCYRSEDTDVKQASLENLLISFEAIRSDKLTASDAWLKKLITRYLKNAYERNKYEYYDNPLSPTSGMQTQLPILLAEYPFREKQDISDYLALLEQTDQYFSSLLSYYTEKSNIGLSLPASFLKEVRKQCDTIVSYQELEKQSNFLQTTFSERLIPLQEAGIITEQEAEKYIATNNRLLKTVLLPAYEALGDEMLLLEDPSVPLRGLSGLPDGKEYYKSLLISETGSYRDIEEIRNLLLAQFTEEYRLLNELLQTNPEIWNRYATGDTVHFPDMSISEMLADLQKRMEGSFPEIAGEGVVTTVKAVSTSLENYCAPAFYLTTPLDDDHQNTIYINESKTPGNLELYTTLAHEGFPGHLYQTVYSNRHSLATNERPVRELLWYGGFLEGWALYVEFLSYDYASDLLNSKNLEEDALLTQIEKHNRNLQLCLYSIIDIMIHYDNASYNQIAELLEHFGIQDSSSIKSVYTYILGEPCNYLKYYLGFLEIKILRENAKLIWADSYSDYRFHQFLLDNGPADFQSLSELLCAPQI